MVNYSFTAQHSHFDLLFREHFLVFFTEIHPYDDTILWQIPPLYIPILLISALWQVF